MKIPEKVFIPWFVLTLVAKLGFLKFSHWIFLLCRTIQCMLIVTYLLFACWTQNQKLPTTGIKSMIIIHHHPTITWRWPRLTALFEFPRLVFEMRSVSSIYGIIGMNVILTVMQECKVHRIFFYCHFKIVSLWHLFPLDLDDENHENRKSKCWKFEFVVCCLQNTNYKVKTS